MTIKILPPQLANQIAAGEVVERPASVVKELVENALDAGATKIDIEIERGGHKRILIRDNGKGIDKEQLSLALSRHATSKIANIDDLEAIMSLGFRGEALASISSVSRLTMTSKPASQKEAWSAIAEGLDMAVEVKPAAHPDGTSVDVVDLFFNTPARRKFLRAEKTEFSHIESLIKRIALSRPDVTFILKHNAKVVKRYRGQSSEISIAAQFSHRIGEVINPGFVTQSNHTELNYDNVTIKVWVKQPELCVSVNPAQFSFVNGRMMRDKLIQHAIRQAFAESLHSEQQPEYVVFIDLPATDVDVNVHPAKHEVRFHYSRLLHDLVVRVIQDALAGFNKQQDIDVVESDKCPPDWLAEPNQQYVAAVQQTQVPKPELQPVRASSTYSALKPSSCSRKPRNEGITPKQHDVFQQYVEANKSIAVSSEHKDVKTIVEPQVTPETTESRIEIVFIEAQRFVYLKWNNGLYLLDWQQIDIKPEQNIDLTAQQLLPTPLLVPVRLKLSESEVTWCEQNLPVLKQAGFDGKVHGQYLILKQVPNVLRQKSDHQTLPVILEHLMRNENMTVEFAQESLMTPVLEPLCEQKVLTWFANQKPESTGQWLKNHSTRLSGAKLLSLLNSKNN